MLVKLAVERYIAHEDFHNLRNKLLPYAEKAVCLTDEVFLKLFHENCI